MVDDLDENGNPVRVLKETTIGRILFNQVVPEEVGYINELLTKRSLRDIIAVVMKKAGADKVAAFLDDIKNMGYRMAFEGGLSFNLDAVIVPGEKEKLVQEGTTARTPSWRTTTWVLSPTTSVTTRSSTCGPTSTPSSRRR